MKLKKIESFLHQRFLSENKDVVKDMPEVLSELIETFHKLHERFKIRGKIGADEVDHLDQLDSKIYHHLLREYEDQLEHCELCESEQSDGTMPSKEEALSELADMLEDIGDSWEELEEAKGLSENEEILSALLEAGITEELTPEQLKEAGLKAKLNFFETRIGDFVLKRTELLYDVFRLVKEPLNTNVQ